jgi:hypothetical protein
MITIFRNCKYFHNPVTWASIRFDLISSDRDVLEAPSESEVQQ